MKKERLIIFTRYPQPGTTKTRMIPRLGAEGAANLHRKLTEATLTTAQHLQEMRSLSVMIAYSGGNLAAMQTWLGETLDYQAQQGADLGERMKFACQNAFNEGMEKAVIIGTDCLELTPEILNQAFESLNQADLVLGPAQDGGYYLIGLKRLIPELFRRIAWGTDQVFSQTQAIARSLSLTSSNLIKLRDLDRPEDLESLKETPFQSSILNSQF